MEYECKKISESSIGVAPIMEDSESLLSQLDNKAWYLPFIEKMPEHRKREWLSVRVLLKKLLGEEKEILYLPSGKPYLADHSWHISISHTKYKGIAGQARNDSCQGYVAVILNKEEAVAIDIEKISPRIENIRSRFVSEAEEKALSKTNALQHLLLHWSAKESIFKRLGVENVDFKTQLHIAPFAPIIGEWSRFRAHETRTEKRNTFTVNYFVAEDYVLTCIQ
jgi:phosphopantetheinyl transferase